MSLWPIALACLAPLAAVGLRTLPLSELQVTEGVIGPAAGAGMSIEQSKVRAVSRLPGGRVAELRFRYLGPTSSIAPLDDGEPREQLGLKLRAQDACNVVYVMWRLKPRSELAVQVKSNPGQRTSRECGARGYRKLPMHVALPALQAGDRHVLRAAFMDGDRIEVSVDGKPAWSGWLGGVTPIDGPVGLRTDNVRVELDLASDGAAP